MSTRGIASTVGGRDPRERATEALPPAAGGEFPTLRICPSTAGGLGLAPAARRRPRPDEATMDRRSEPTTRPTPTPGACALLLLLLLLATAARADVKATRHRVRTASGVAAVDCYAPTSEGRHPAIVLLPGVGGQDPILNRIGKALAARGYVAVVPNLTMAEDPNDVETSMDAVRRVLDFAAARPGVDPDRLGMFGYSKGSYLAGFVGSRDRRVKAVVQVEGAVFPTVNRTPPAIFVIRAGEGDAPPELVGQYLRALKEKGAEVRFHVYPGVDHNLTDRHMMDAGRRSAAFFDEFLGEKKKAGDAAEAGGGEGKAGAPAAGEAGKAARPGSPKGKSGAVARKR